MCEDDESIARRYGRVFVFAVSFLIVFVPLTTSVLLYANDRFTSFIHG